MDVPHYVLDGATYVTALGILWGAVSWVSRPIMREVTRILNVVTTIEAEFRPNGGSTLRDHVAQIGAGLRARDDVDSEAMFYADAAGNVTRANRALQRLAQRGNEDFLGSGWEHVIAEEQRDRVWAAWCDAVQRRRTFESAFDIIAIDGTRYAIDCIAAPIRDGENVTGWIGKYRHAEHQQIATPRRRRA